MTIAPDRPTTRPRTVHDLPMPEDGWTERAACRGVHVDLFITGGPGRGNRNLAARRLCDTCPVVRDCLLAAVRENDRSSIRGAMSPPERDGWLRDQGIPRRPAAATGAVLNSRGPYRAIDVDQVLAMARAGASQQAMADALGCAKETVARRLKAARAAGLIQ